MKKILLTALLCGSALQANLSIKQIEMMVNKIHEKRVGVSLDILDTTKEPFAKREEKTSPNTFVTLPENDSVKLSLHAIMNGKAYINDGWKRLDDTVMGYKLKYIGKRGVVLRNGNNIKKLFLYNKRKDNFIKIEERD
jgi:hypothetical protein